MDAAELNFSWVVDEKLAGCAGPVLETELEFLISKKVGALIRLTGREEGAFEEEDIIKAGMQDCHEPVQDFNAPSQEQIDRVIQFVDRHLEQGTRVAVSCVAGRGRTGTILSCYFVSKGLSSQDAVYEVKRRGRKPYETQQQLEAIQEYERRHKGV